ncbi:MAG: hypothetical protein JWP97_6587 [Labilithrix sp.]|nr:hypothetical protein [Labilithrix sp.]
MRLLSRALGAGALALTLCTTGLAYAGDTSTAETLFKAGLDAMKKSQYREACEAFGGSNEADPSPGTQINLALCNEKQGKLASAWGWYRTAAGLADQRGQRERAELARGEAAKLEPKLHKLVVAVKPPPPEGLQVTRNGASVPNATLGAEIPVDPGEYTIEVTARNKKPFKRAVQIASTPGVDRVDVPLLEDLPPEVKPPAGEGRPTSGADYVRPESEPDHTRRNVGFILGGAGIVAGAVAVGVELLALNEDDKSKQQKSNADAIKAPPGGTLTNAQRTDQASYQASAVDHHDAAKNDELIAIITGIGAVALIGTGVVLVLTAPSGKKEAALTRPVVVPLLGRDTAGIGLVGRF